MFDLHLTGLYLKFFGAGLAGEGGGLERDISNIISIYSYRFTPGNALQNRSSVWLP